MVNQKKNSCGGCHKEVAKNSKSIACAVCEFWFHFACVEGMTDPFYDSCAEAYKTWGYSAFFCKCCRKAMSKMNHCIKELKEEVESLKTKVEAMEKEKEKVSQRVNKVEKRAEKVKEDLEGVEREMVNGMEKAKEEAKKEMKVELKREEKASTNIAVYGIKEPANEEERKKEEREKIEELARVLEVELEGEVEVQYRAGKKPEEGGKPRPLIVKVADDETRARILSSGRKLSRVDGWKNVFVAPDSTFEQREERRKNEKALRDDAAKRTAEAKEAKKEVEWIVVGRGESRRVIEIPLRD